MGMELKQWIRDARKHAKLSQEKLGEELGLTKSNISHWEAGKHEPSFGQLVRIVAVTKYEEPLPGLKALAKASSWPFEDVSLEKVESLSDRQRIQLEAALLLSAGNLGLDIANKSQEAKATAA